jgi:ribose 5-phosphate isomerase A
VARSSNDEAVEKRAAAEAAAGEVEDGAVVGLGTGTTVGYFLPALARRGADVQCIASSPRTERAAHELGIRVIPFDRLERIDLAVDGADQVSPELWLIKGGGGAHTREKVMALAASRFLVIVSPSKLVNRLAPPVPLEVMSFGLGSTLRLIARMGEVRLRDAPATPDGNVLADFIGPMDDPRELARDLDAIPGIVEHGLFPPGAVSEVLVGRADGDVDRLRSPVTP